MVGGYRKKKKKSEGYIYRTEVWKSQGYWNQALNPNGWWPSGTGQRKGIEGWVDRKTSWSIQPARETPWPQLTLWHKAVKAEILGSKSEDTWAPHRAASEPQHLPLIFHKVNKTQNIHTILLARAQRQEHTISLSSSRRLEIPLTGNLSDVLIGQLESHVYGVAWDMEPRDRQPQQMCINALEKKMLSRR